MSNAELQQRIALATAPAWMPKEKGDTLEKATVIGLQIGHTDEYGDYPKIVYRLQDGSFIAVHAFHQVLSDRLKELKTAVGSVQTLVYLGKQESNSRTDSEGNPQKYHMFYVENDGQRNDDVAKGFSWDLAAERKK